MKLSLTVVAGVAFSLLTPSFTLAHFGMVIPSTNSVSQNEKELDVKLSFSHPMELIGMELTQPQKFYVVHEKTTEDLLPTITQTSVMDHGGWLVKHKPKRPGVYQYIMEPTPYWEEAENLYIIHYTKTIVSAYGDEENWDTPVGLPTEIVPLTRPFANYAGNGFSGIVLVGGQPAADTEVEVEFYNRDKTISPPTDQHITQVVKTNSNGAFSFTCPFPGWWGFSALSEADYTMTGPDNKEKGVELGAVLWVFFNNY